MLVQAGLDGVRRGLDIETQQPPPLPTSLSEALGPLEKSEAAAQWLGAGLHSAYLAFKRAEVEGLGNRTRRRSAAVMRRPTEGENDMSQQLSREVEIEPAHTALLFVDVQHFNCTWEGGEYAA